MLPRDLLQGLAVLCLLSGAIFECGFRLARGGRRWISATLFCLASAIAAGAWLHGQLHVARILPFSNVILVGNWLPLAAAMLMGGIAAVRQMPAGRRIVLAGMLGTVAWYTVVEDLSAPAPPVGPPRFWQGFCLQSTPASCSPCCAAALLMDHEIQATEAEMVKLCLSRFDGTPELGLYRGLKLKTRGTPWDVEIVSGDFESLRQPGGAPAIVFVNAGDDGLEGVPIAWFFRRQSHAVVIYGFDGNGNAAVGDPGVGRGRWKADQLRHRWCGTGLRLVRRRFEHRL